MSDLNTGPNLERSDDVYASLLAAHDGLDGAQSHALNARLVLILMNHIGRADILLDAIAAARPT